MVAVPRWMQESGRQRKVPAHQLKRRRKRCGCKSNSRKLCVVCRKTRVKHHRTVLSSNETAINAAIQVGRKTLKRPRGRPQDVANVRRALWVIQDKLKEGIKMTTTVEMQPARVVDYRETNERGKHKTLAWVIMRKGNSPVCYARPIEEFVKTPVCKRLRRNARRVYHFR